MVSVTSEVAASASLQVAPPRPAPDPGDDFSQLEVKKKAMERYAETYLKYQDPLSGDDRALVLQDLQAHAVQHEHDHIDGIMFFTRVPKNPRKRLMAKWEKERVRALAQGLGI